MRRVVALGMALLVLAGCGVRPSEVIPAGEAPRQKATAQTMLYWLNEGRLVAHPRLTAEYLSPDNAVEALLQGPTPAEQGLDLSTALPVVEVLVVVSFRDGLVEIMVDTGVAGWSESAMDQVTCTAVNAMGQDGPVAIVGNDERRDHHDCPVL